MSKLTPVRSAVTLITLVALSMVSSAGVASAQENSPSDQPVEKVSAKSKFRGRLPAYFKNVVSESQRSEIYKIQKSYHTQIQDLQKQIAELLEKRDTEVLDVLTEKQQKQVEELSAAAAESRRGKESEEAEPTEVSADEDTPATSSD